MFSQSKDIYFAYLQRPEEASAVEESLEDQEMAEVEVTPSVNSLVEAFLGAFRLEDDAFLLDDGLVCVGGGR